MIAHPLAAWLETKTYAALKHAVDREDEMSNGGFCACCFDGDDPGGEYIEAFIQGAKELFAEIRNQL